MSREEWAKRVERWKDSGLTAKEFASELGIKPGTLQQWKYQFDGERRGTRSPTGRGKSARRSSPLSTGFAKLPTEVVSGPSVFELSVGQYQVKVPTSFDAEALKRLLQALEVNE